MIQVLQSNIEVIHKYHTVWNIHVFVKKNPRFLLRFVLNISEHFPIQHSPFDF